MSDPISNAAGEPADKPKREFVPPVSLLRFLRDKTIETRGYLAATRRMPPPPLGEAERTDLSGLLNQSADALLRLESLLSELPNGESEIARQTIQSVEAYISGITGGSVGPALQKGAGADSVWQLLRWLHSTAQDKDQRKQREVAVRLALQVARLNGALSDQEYVELATRAFPPGGANKSGKLEIAGVGAVLAPVLHRKSSRDALLQLSAFFGQQVKHLTESVELRDRALSERAREIESLKAELAKQTSEIASLRQIVAQRDNVIETLEKDVGDFRAVKRQSERQLRARTAGVLNDQLLPLVRDIHDAASMTPPRAHVILDRTESATSIIQSEAAWLKSSD